MTMGRQKSDDEGKKMQNKDQAKKKVLEAKSGFAIWSLTTKFLLSA
jgi:hypothetical protein